MLIKNGHVIDPKNNVDEVLDIRIRDGKVVEIAKDLSEDGEEIIDAKGLVVSPGLVDVHVHFRDPGFTHKEDIYSGANAAARGGFTTVVCMGNTNPTMDNEDTLKSFLERSKKCPINVKTIATVSKKLNGKEFTDFEKLIELGAVGLSDDGVVIKDGKFLKDALDRAYKLNVPVSLHEEDSDMLGSHGVNEGEVAKAFNVKGASKVSEYSQIAKDLAIGLSTKGHIHIQHISCKESVEIIKLFKELGVNATCEVTPNHFSLNEEDVLKIGTLARINPPIRTEEDRLALIEGLKDGTVDMIATDHAPHTMKEKEREFERAPSGILGLETSLSLSITKLVKPGHLTLQQLIEKMSLNPAKLFNFPAGEIKKDFPADITIFNPDEEIVYDEFVSKSKNSPYVGMKLQGVVKYTICGGKVVYRG
ncbi:dihydroorotase [Mediannikoviicoccus vaginalis]|uniref:dihydroorotase n=1 Tax=Mediannikoviicoccus vaginalis TaxID=2899727 RepID=UPI001EFFB33B|nr:dihydroorotase [Mediannikoviicoccus vaginalis]